METLVVTPRKMADSVGATLSRLHKPRETNDNLAESPRPATVYVFGPPARQVVVGRCWYCRWRHLLSRHAKWPIQLEHLFRVCTNHERQMAIWLRAPDRQQFTSLALLLGK